MKKLLIAATVLTGLVSYGAMASTPAAPHQTQKSTVGVKHKASDFNKTQTKETKGKHKAF